MKWKKFLSTALAIIFCFTACSFYIEPSAATEYNFTERIVYGGTAIDIGDYIYYANTNDDMKLYRRLVGDEETTLIYDSPVGYLNVLEENLYFISENRIISTSLTGSDERILFNSDNDIIDLYATSDCFYFLSLGEIFRLDNGDLKSVFTNEDMCAFLPINKYVFKWYVNNPEYVEVDQAAEEFYTETPDKYLTYTYDTRTNLNSFTKPLIVEPVYTGTTTDYTGPYVEVGDVTLPLAEYMPGTFFSKNGKACTCHHDPTVDCVESLSNCNCMRYWPTGIKSTCEIDLLGSQCFGFARFVFYKCFGFIDHSLYNPGKFYNVGSIRSGSVTASSVKELFMKANTGAHVRLTRGHSISILTMDADFLTVYHGNAGGDGVASQPCVVSTKRFTWEQFAAYAVAGVSYVNMPVVYPDDVNVTIDEKIAGYYKVTTEGTSSLNVRSGAGTSNPSIGTLAADSFINVLEVSSNWGRIQFNNNTDGWICLDYARFQTLAELTPSTDSDFYIDTTNGVLVSNSEQNDFSDFAGCFPNQTLTAFDCYGNDLSDGGYIGTGSIVNIAVNETVVDSMSVIVCGDANGNGIIDVGDYLVAKRIFFGNYTADNVCFSAVDINSDKKIDAIDCLFMKRYLIGVTAFLRFD